MTTRRTPRVWLLLDDKPGHATQVRGLARMLGWPAEEKQLQFNWLNRLPSPLLGATRASVLKPYRDHISGAFPDVVIGMGRRVSPVAKWIGAASGGRTRIVLFGRKAAGGADQVDALVTCMHFGMVPGPKVVELDVPPTQIDGQILAEIKRSKPDPMVALPHPRAVLLVGGPTAHHCFEAAFAGAMLRALAAAAAKQQASLTAVTSRRTPAAAIAAMREAAPEAHFHVWQSGNADNPYLSYIANADLLIVTGESESMLAEAAASGLPLTIYPLPARKAGAKLRFAKWARKKAESGGRTASFATRLFRAGWISAPRDVGAFHRVMEARGLARVFDGTINVAAPRERVAHEEVRERIVALLGMEAGPHHA